MKIGLRIDVDTLRGTRDGVPALLKILAESGIRATFFFSVGPDNMGRHLRRLLKPAFLKKMIRSRAASLYGWDILLRGTFWPGPLIGPRCKEIIRAAVKEGHEAGLHCWDHYKWQAQIDNMDGPAIREELRLGYEMLSDIAGVPPVCSAVPGWKCTPQVLVEKHHWEFRFNSDCRGESVFYPFIEGKRSSQPQIPVTLPTYDEVVGREGITGESFGDYILSRLRKKALNVLTIHAEAEGIAIRNEFMQFIKKAKTLGHEFSPLGAVLNAASAVPVGRIGRGEIPGREGWISIQQNL
jgi:undecaprenyl phosphate-alpha-L-ara4FN deformylase